MARRRLVARLGAEHADDLTDQVVSGDGLDRSGRGAVGDASWSILKWLDASDATCGRCVMHRTCAPLGKLAKALADRPRGRAANAGVDLVEDARRAAAPARQAGQGEHHARKLAARRRIAKRRDGHARVRRDPQLHRLRSARAEPVRVRRPGRTRPRAARRPSKGPSERLGDGLLELRAPPSCATSSASPRAPARSARVESTRCASSPASSSAPSSRAISARQRSA